MTEPPAWQRCPTDRLCCVDREALSAVDERQNQYILILNFIDQPIVLYEEFADGIVGELGNDSSAHWEPS